MTWDLTVNVCVLRSASGVGIPEHTADSLALLKRMKKHEEAYLALDTKGRILYQYEQQLGEQTFARDWLRRMSESSKVKLVKRCSLKYDCRDVFTRLQEAHFDCRTKEDTKYVETAAVTTSKTLVTVDFGNSYRPKVCKILKKKKLGVHVQHPKDASARLAPHDKK